MTFGGSLVRPDGYIYDPEGISGEKIDYMLELRASGSHFYPFLPLQAL